MINHLITEIHHKCTCTRAGNQSVDQRLYSMLRIFWMYWYVHHTHTSTQIRYWVKYIMYTCKQTQLPLSDIIIIMYMYSDFDIATFGIIYRKSLLSEGLSFLMKVYHLFSPIEKTRYCIFNP